MRRGLDEGELRVVLCCTGVLCTVLSCFTVLYRHCAVFVLYCASLSRPPCVLSSGGMWTRIHSCVGRGDDIRLQDEHRPARAGCRDRPLDKFYKANCESRAIVPRGTHLQTADGQPTNDPNADPICLCCRIQKKAQVEQVKKGNFSGGVLNPYGMIQQVSNSTLALAAALSGDWTRVTDPARHTCRMRKMRRRRRLPR